MPTNYYLILRSAKADSAEAITEQWKILARSMHPDRNLYDPSATEKFAQLSQAYAVLSNKKTRKTYDTVSSIGACDCQSCQGTGRLKPKQKGFQVMKGSALICPNCQGAGVVPTVKKTR